MNVESLRRHLLALVEPAPAEAAGLVRDLAAALAPFDSAPVPAFLRFLDQARPYYDAGSAKPPAPRGRRPARNEAELEQERQAKQEAKDRAARDKAEAKRAADLAKQQAKQAADHAKRAERHRKLLEKQRLAAELAERKRAEAAALPAAPPEIAALAADLNDLIARSKREQSTYAEIDQHIARLAPLTRPKLMLVAKLIQADAGLASKSKGEIVKLLGTTLRQVLGTAQRVKM